MEDNFLSATFKQFQYYKMLGEKAISQVQEEDGLFWSPHEESNSIAVIVKHLWGNMLSRWTDFLDTDGEKEWRKRDEEFVGDLSSRKEIMQKWEEGWNCLFNSLQQLTEEDRAKIVHIRNQGHTVTEAILRQLAHYAYHVGQIVFVCKLLAGDTWSSLSIPRNKSGDYNAEKFKAAPGKTHFTDEWLKKE